MSISKIMHGAAHNSLTQDSSRARFHQLSGSKVLLTLASLFSWRTLLSFEMLLRLGHRMLFPPQ